ncbi:hypothetical protein B9Z65_1032 [Elsinoe australis]|uniref:PWI domain-containing protein n=1 Tax=Elsinoe australis TaxID=40998 RepID=A0A2P8AI69_9PEZI|nr:hypothetical protein B9Z65_1032 [Elsinoe australis]
MPPIITNVDQKLLRDTKFPPEFNRKVDTTKVNVPVIKNWAAGEVSKLLGFEDDVVIGLLFDLLEGEKHPNVKVLQLQLAGFLGDDAPSFCQQLWNLCLSAQESATGVPQQLLEAKKAELMQERQEQEQAAEQARRRRDQQDSRDRELDDVRFRERRERDDRRFGDRGGRGGRDVRDFDRRPPPRRDFSRSPPPRRPRPDYDYGRRPPPRDMDSYVPSSSSRSFSFEKPISIKGSHPVIQWTRLSRRG